MKPGAFRNFAVARDAFVRALLATFGMRVHSPAWFAHEKHPGKCNPGNCDISGNEWRARRNPRVCPLCGSGWAADIEFDTGKARECMRCGHWGFL